MIIFIQVVWYCIKHYAGVIDIVWMYWLSIEPFRIEIIDCGCVRCISFNSRSPELTDRQLNINWCPFPYSISPISMTGSGWKDRKWPDSDRKWIHSCFSKTTGDFRSNTRCCAGHNGHWSHVMDWKKRFFSFFLVMSWCSGCAWFITDCLLNDYMQWVKDI